MLHLWKTSPTWRGRAPPGWGVLHMVENKLHAVGNEPHMVRACSTGRGMSPTWWACSTEGDETQEEGACIQTAVAHWGSQERGRVAARPGGALQARAEAVESTREERFSKWFGVAGVAMGWGGRRGVHQRRSGEKAPGRSAAAVGQVTGLLWWEGRAVLGAALPRRRSRASAVLAGRHGRGG